MIVTEENITCFLVENTVKKNSKEDKKRKKLLKSLRFKSSNNGNSKICFVIAETKFAWKNVISWEVCSTC